MFKSFFLLIRLIFFIFQEQDAYALDLVQLKFRFHGGKHSPVLDENVTHVVLDARYGYFALHDTERLSINSALKSCNKQ